MSAETLEFTSRLIEKKLKDFGVEVKVLAAYPGPVITRYEIEPAIGVKGSQIVNLVKDLARALSVVSIRVVETIPGKSCMGLEIPNPRRQTVRLTEILGSKAYHDLHSPLTLALGKDIGGNPVVVDLAKMPHLLVAGTTGSGKSVALNAMILSLLYKAEPRDVRLIMVDPKMLELSVYQDIPHLLAPVVTDMKQAASALHVVRRRDGAALQADVVARRAQPLRLQPQGRRGREARRAARGPERRSRPSNPVPLQKLPHIVVVIDELADLMMVVGKKVEELIARLAQKARAAGIHLILATQRPSVDVITGLIKANIPTRIAFQVSSQGRLAHHPRPAGRGSAARAGRHALPAAGHRAAAARARRVRRRPGSAQGRRLPQAAGRARLRRRPARRGRGRRRQGDLGAGEGGGEADPLYDQAVEIVLRTRRPSISLVQRHLRIGYNRAARLIEQMEQAGLVSAMQTNGNREVLVPSRGGAERCGSRPADRARARASRVRPARIRLARRCAAEASTASTSS